MNYIRPFPHVYALYFNQYDSSEYKHLEMLDHFRTKFRRTYKLSKNERRRLKKAISGYHNKNRRP